MKNYPIISRIIRAYRLHPSLYTVPDYAMIDRTPYPYPEFHTINGREYAVLYNDEGLLACYRVYENQRVRKLRNPPKQIVALYKKIVYQPV